MVRKTVIDKDRIKKTIDADIQVENNRVIMDYRADSEVQPCSLLIMEGQNTIVWERNLTDEETADRIISEDFCDFVCSRWARLNYSFRIALKYRAEGQDDHEIAVVINNKKRGKKTYYELIKLHDIEMENGVSYPDLIVMPYHMGKNGQFAVRLSKPELMMVKFIHCDAQAVKYERSRFAITVMMPKTEKPVRNVLLVSRRGDAKYPMEYTIAEKGSKLEVRAAIDLNKIALVDPFWSICIETEMFGYPVWIQPSVPTKLEKHLKITSSHGYLGNDVIFFAQPLKTGLCQLVIRKKEFFDSRSVRIKELFAIMFFKVFGLFYKGKGCWLVFEKFCSAAQDNGYAFFRFCMENLGEKEKKHIYYVLDRNSSAYDEVKKYGKHVVDFMSFRHMLYCLAADMYIASESKSHLYAWRGKPSLISSMIRNKPIFFLQHGVTALKRVDNIFGKSGTDPMTYFVATSKKEQDIIVDNFGYLRENVPVLGFTRWDMLDDTSTDDDQTILVMPTWRKWIQDSGVGAFADSDYFRNYSGLLRNEKLTDALRDKSIKLLFYMHPKFKEYMGEFSGNMQTEEDSCEVIAFGEKPLNGLIRSSKMVITDYSSVCWDFYYLKKPVVFYQFDYDLYMENHGSYIDMTRELCGDRYINEEELVDGIIDYIYNGFKEKRQFADMRQELFEYVDHDNCRRTYEFLKAIK